MEDMPLNFTAIDFETANRSPASPCAVGMVKVREGQIVDSLSMLFKPPFPNDYFQPANINVHGITPEMVLDAPSWEEAIIELMLFAETDTLIAHNAGFDIGVLRASAEAINFDLPNYGYGCSLRMSRKTYNLDSYRLNAVAYAIGHEEFQHHDALADSDACARIVLHMANRHDVESLDDLMLKTSERLKTVF
ncbi:MAG TPA: 3'-5' exonuclease [Microbacteriaceae bacterium]